jgi:hypothetical protein
VIVGVKESDSVGVCVEEGSGVELTVIVADGLWV